MKTKTPRAPKKLSTAINIALADQRKAEKHEDMVIAMNAWHVWPARGSGNHPDLVFNKCHVCFAGAVMHFRFALPITLHADPEDYDTFGAGWQAVFRALDYVRSGRVCRALKKMNLLGIATPCSEWDIAMPNYAEDRKGFRKTMRKVSKELKEAGL